MIQVGLLEDRVTENDLLESLDSGGAAGVQRKEVSFFVSSVSGLAISAKPWIKGHWYPKTPSILQTCLMVASCSSQVANPSYFVGLILMAPLLMTMPK
jgi:hypothetical protein